MPSLAEKYDFELFTAHGNAVPAIPIEEPHKRPRPKGVPKKPKVVNSPKIKENIVPIKRVKRNWGQIALGTLAFIVITGVAGFSIQRNVELVTLTNQIETVQEELKTAKAVEQQLQLELETKFNSVNLQKYARYTLGMSPISKSQVVYVNSDKEDKGTVYKPISEKSEIARIIESIKELFK